MSGPSGVLYKEFESAPWFIGPIDRLKVNAKMLEQGVSACNHLSFPFVFVPCGLEREWNRMEETGFQTISRQIFAALGLLSAVDAAKCCTYG